MAQEMGRQKVASLHFYAKKVFNFVNDIAKNYDKLDFQLRYYFYFRISF